MLSVLSATLILEMLHQSATTCIRTIFTWNLEELLRSLHLGHDDVAGRDTCILLVATLAGEVASCVPERRHASPVVVLLFNVTATLINKHSDSTLAHALLVLQRSILHAPRYFVKVLSDLLRSLIVMHPVCILLQQLVALLVHLLLNDVLAQDLIVEFQWLLIDQLVVEALSIGRLHNIAL